MKKGTFFICMLAFIACSNVKKNRDVKDLSSTNIEMQSVNIDRKKITLIEAVVNLPDVLKYSKVKDARKKNIRFYLFEEELSKNPKTIIIKSVENLIRINDKPAKVRGRNYYENKMEGVILIENYNDEAIDLLIKATIIGNDLDKDDNKYLKIKSKGQIPKSNNFQYEAEWNLKLKKGEQKEITYQYSFWE